LPAAAAGAILLKYFPGVLAVLTNALNRDTYGNFAIFNNLLNIMVSSGEGQSLLNRRD
jgi:hypothetical protein